MHLLSFTKFLENIESLSILCSPLYRFKISSKTKSYHWAVRFQGIFGNVFDVLYFILNNKHLSFFLKSIFL